MNKGLKPILLVGNSHSPETVAALEQSGLFEIITASIGKFNSGEPFVELMKGQEAMFDANLAALQGRKAFILQSTAEPVSENFQYLSLMAHTLKLYGVGELTAIEPFAAGMRQDRKFDKRFPSVAADMYAKQTKAAGVDKLITFTPHSQDAIDIYKAVFGDNFTAISATEMFAEDIRARFGNDPALLSIGAPDGADKKGDQGQARARTLATAVFGTDSDENMFFIAKEHTSVNETRIRLSESTIDVAGKACVIVDDMIDGGSTMINAASLLKSRGATSVTCYATHGILSGNAIEKLLSAKPDGVNNAIDKLVIADTIPGVREKLAALLKEQPSFAGRVEIISVGPALVKEITRDLSPAPAPLRRKFGASGM